MQGSLSLEGRMGWRQLSDRAQLMQGILGTVRHLCRDWRRGIRSRFRAATVAATYKGVAAYTQRTAMSVMIAFMI